jgi:signal transduction histidine kinase
VAIVDRFLRWLSSPLVVGPLMWIAICVPVLLADELPQDSLLSPGVFRAVAVPLLALAVLLSWRLPLVAAVLPASLSLGATGDLFTDQLALAQLLFAYLLGRRTVGRQAAVQLGAVLIVLATVYALTGHGGVARDWFELAASAMLMTVLPWTAGQYVRQHSDLLRAGWELAERLEREHDIVVHQVRLRERARIAGDMHDSLGHELSLIAVRAAALQVAPGASPDRQRAAADLRDAAASATEHLHQIIGMLREQGHTAPVVPSGDTVRSLVARADESGMTITFDDDTVGTSEHPPVPEATTRAAYRVVQEALTNAAKHAPGAPVTVTLRRTNHQLVVTVTNTATATSSASPDRPDGTGYGLVGLDERVRLVGGTLSARPTDGGFEVTARLPVTTNTAVSTGPAARPGEGDAVPPPPVTTPTARLELAAARRRLRRGVIGAFWAPGVVAAVLVLLYILNGRQL